MSAGILCKKQVLDLTRDRPEKQRVVFPSTRTSEVDGSSLDLPIGDRYWKMKGSCRPGKNLNVNDIINRYAEQAGGTEVPEGLILEKDKVYLFKADCTLDLKDTEIEGKATARSSIGRLDVLVRLLVDGGTKFDRVPKEHKGDLYLEVAPITFPLQVRPGTRLSQLRLFRGTEQLITLTNEELRHEDDEDFPVVKRDGQPCRAPCTEAPHDVWFPFCLNLTPDPEAGCSAFVAKRDTPADPINPDLKGQYDPTKFWDPVRADSEHQELAIKLEPGRLYILRSKERLRIPAHLALECQAYTETMGEWRIEYAGFAHPWFGRQRHDGRGTPIIFEVRGHNVPTILTDGIPLGNVCFRRMSRPAEEPETEGVYEKQELRLSTCFKAWANG